MLKAGVEGRWVSHSVASALSIALLIVLFQFDFESLRGYLIDFYFRTLAPAEPHPDLLLFSVSRADMDEFESSIEVLAQAKPRAVIWLGPMSEPARSRENLQTLAKGFSKLPSVFIGYTDSESQGLPPPRELSQIAGFLPGFISRDTFSFGADGVTRRVMVTVEGIPTVYAEVACQARRDCKHYRDFANLDAYASRPVSLQTIVRWHGEAGTYPIRRITDIRADESEKIALQDKIILFADGSDAQTGIGKITSPYSRYSGQGMSALEGAAQSLATLLRNDGIRRSSFGLDIVLTLLVALITLNLVLRLSPAYGVVVVVLQIVILLMTGFLCLHTSNFWLNTAHPLLAAVVGYYVVIPYRLIEEYRKRWHFQEKTELMAELEQLKGNFLSLISHDIKTPVSRIQGYTELLLNDSLVLNSSQRERLRSILRTTDDLSEYVETILDLTRVESSSVQLQKVSRDINSTISEVIESKRPMAIEKGINLQLDLETIFSIRFDVGMMRRVLSNLIENAIKYSSQGTTVSIRSREDHPWIRITVVDQGPGIDGQDQQKVFDRFFRCDNEATRTVKGTGLGLYLVKYFVELHKGQVKLASEIGKGSEFTVSLPVLS